jgi:hypothetical protein
MLPTLRAVGKKENPVTANKTRFAREGQGLPCDIATLAWCLAAVKSDPRPVTPRGIANERLDTLSTERFTAEFDFLQENWGDGRHSAGSSHFVQFASQQAAA